ncbi:enoyl-CoA hydratase/isomerase family protein [Georgenia yuyongxinii]|uniref:Enoyl-CoA hydratase n=1 Tax=Georgenia yuyongxinii TaxID=2589797 RepID=A0A552WTM2_9MICO|nr:enoyl-CoA hydratase-related protein [Georgenia yuyongxinii]TRW46152.1 enoyl-CoA hydratase [Georgenia yuyongxinii]
MSADVVHLGRAGAVVTITLDSPANRNALSRLLRTQLGARLADALADPATRVILLTHTGPVFCAGADLTEAGTPDEPGTPDLPALLTTLWHSPVPVVARLAGTARGGGVGLAAACDLVVAADTVTFAFPEVRLGVVPAVISAPLRRRVAPHALHALFLTGEPFDAARAREIGLLDAAAPPDLLDSEVRRLADMVLRGAPGALATTKALLRDPPVGGLAAELAELGRVSHEHFTSAEGREGVRARAEGRDPAWVQELPG